MTESVQMLDLDWSALNAEDARTASIFYLQASGEGFILNAGFVAPPIKDMSDMETGEVRVQASGRIYLSIHQAKILRDLLSNCLDVAAEAEERA